MKNFNMILIEAAKTSALSSGKTDKYEYLTCEEIFPLIKDEYYNKLNLLIPLWEGLL